MTLEKPLTMISTTFAWQVPSFCLILSISIDPCTDVLKLWPVISQEWLHNYRKTTKLRA